MMAAFPVKIVYSRPSLRAGPIEDGAVVPSKFMAPGRQLAASFLEVHFA